MTGRRKDGSIFPMDLAISEIKVDGRRMFTGLGTRLDRAEAAEDALRQARDELEVRVRDGRPS